MFNNVLVAVRDREGGQDALALARQLVSTDGQLTLVRVQVVTRKPSADSAHVREAHERQRELRMLELLRDEAAVDAEVASVSDLSVARGLHATARLQHADLVVVGASRANEIDRMLIGDDTREVLRDAPCAVAVAPLGYAKHARPLAEVAIAYDGSPASQRALEAARQVAADAKAKLLAFQAVPSEAAGGDPWNPYAEIAGTVETAARRIAVLGDVEPVVRSGEPAAELARFQPSVDLLVIGTHKHTRIDRFLRVSTSETLAERPRSPLLVLPPADSGA
jgi:nucleotide-binding universal stress UspA family protein